MLTLPPIGMAGDANLRQTAWSFGRQQHGDAELLKHKHEARTARLIGKA